MSSQGLATLVALVVVALAALAALAAGAAVAAGAARAPAPLPRLAGCRAAGDCPPPEVCVAGGCTDPALPGLLGAAQEAAGRYHDTLQLAAASLGLCAGHATALVAAAGPPLVAAVGSQQALDQILQTLAQNINGGVAALDKYIQDNLAAPACSPGQPATCGYWLGLAGLTPRSSAAAIWGLASQARDVAATLPAAAQAFPPVAAGLGTLAAAAASARALNRDAATALGVVEADIARLNEFETGLPGLADEVGRTGAALYGHYIA